MLNNYVRTEITTKISQVGQSSDPDGLTVRTVEKSKKTTVQWYFLETAERDCIGHPVGDRLNNCLEATYQALQKTFG